MPTKILIVDDEKALVEIMAERLKHRGFDVQAAFRGAEALTKLQDRDADVVILDVRIPEMDGLETLRAIKRIRPLTEVILLTGHASVEAALEGMKQGAHDYLIKPAEFDKLLDRIRSAGAIKAERAQPAHSA